MIKKTIFFVDWERVLKSDELNADNSIQIYLHKLYLDIY